MPEPSRMDRTQVQVSTLRAQGTDALITDATPDIVYQIGVAPRRIDILTSISGVAFELAWQNRNSVQMDGLSVPVIGRAELLTNKRATGRAKDLIDVDMLDPPKQ